MSASEIARGSRDRVPGIFRPVSRLVRHISRRRRSHFLLLLVLMIVSALAEVVSLGAVLPFLGILTAPEKVLSYPLVAGLVSSVGLSSSADLVLLLTVAFVLAALVAGGLRLLMLWASTRLAFATGADLSTEVYRRTLYQPYSVHVARNSSEIISSITLKVSIATSVLVSVLALASSSVTLVAVVLALLAIDPMVATVAALCFGASYGTITWLARRRLARNSQRIAREQVHVVKALQEGLGGIRDVLLDGTQSAYIDIYRKADQPLRRAHGDNVFMNQSPRYIMEALGMTLIAGLAYSLSLQSGGIGTALPVLGALALGAQRLLPALQQLYSNWANIAGGQDSLNDVIALLEQPPPEEQAGQANQPLAFRDNISLEDVSFRYGNDGPWVIDGFSLAIPRGARIGFVGATGGGKSTLLDLIMMLLVPTKGRILVDGQIVDVERRRAWQRTVAHVPQSIYLADTTLAENIAFGVPAVEIDMARVRQAAAQAQIAEFIENHSEGYRARVGERGIRLSGGQRQRIGIARALYKQATVLIFDEATSALDSATEQAVIDAIDRLDRDLTLLIIAHRLTTVARCDTIVQLEHGRIVAQGAYQDLFGQTTSLRPAAAVN